MQNNNQKYINVESNQYLDINNTTTSDTFTINRCGKFSETSKTLTRAEAALLYVELHKWLFPEEIETSVLTKL